MTSKHAIVSTLLVLAACSPGGSSGQSTSALRYPVADGGACAVGESGCNGPGSALYACVADAPGEAHWGSPTLCPLGCVTAAPASDGLEQDYCRCVDGARRTSKVGNECFAQTCVAGAWSAAHPMRCIPGTILDESTCTGTCVGVKCAQ
jgi:hypothetical protein